MNEASSQREVFPVEWQVQSQDATRGDAKFPADVRPYPKNGSSLKLS